MLKASSHDRQGFLGSANSSLTEVRGFFVEIP